MKKYFIPNEQNEYKPHFLRKAAVGAVAGFAIFVFFASTFHGLLLYGTDLLSAVIPRALVDLANANRVSSNVTTLAENPILVRAAQMKADDMAQKGYFAHVSPEGVTPWYWFNQAGYEYVYAGENLAVNFSDSLDVDRAWMNSPSHRSNILNGRFTEIGIATARGKYNGRDTIFVVQMFGRPLPAPTRFVGAENAEASERQAPNPFEEVSSNETDRDPIVLSESDTFVAVENADAGLAQSDLTPSQTTEISRNTVLTSPRQNLTAIYIVLAGVVILALLLMILVEIKRQHPRNIAMGVLLLLFIVGLLFVYREILFPEVLIV